MWTLTLGVPIGCRSPRKRGPYSMPNDKLIFSSVISRIHVISRRSASVTVGSELGTEYGRASTMFRHFCGVRRRALAWSQVTERRRRAAKSLTNVIEIVSAEWAARLKLGLKGYRVQNIPTGDDCSNEYR